MCFGKCCAPLTYIDGAKGQGITFFHFGACSICTILVTIKMLFDTTLTSEWNDNLKWKLPKIKFSFSGIA